MRKIKRIITYMEETVLVLEHIIIHVVVEDAISDAEFKLCEELLVFHDIQAIENIEADAIWAEVL
jgi:hypothetical protein